MNPTPTYQRAVEDFHNAPPAKAYESALALCHEQPGQYEAEQMAGMAAQIAGHQEWALKHLAQAVNLTNDPQNLAATWTCLGRAYLDLRMPDKAEPAFSRALTLVTNFPAALVGLSETYNFLGQYGKAAELGERSIKLGFPNIRSYVALGIAHMRLKDFDRATQNFKQALELDPASEPARFGLGAIERINGNFQEAEKYFRSGEKSNSDFADFNLLAGLKKFQDEDDPDLVVMKQMIEDPAVSDVSKEGLAFALAKACDDINNPREATRYLIQANEYAQKHEFRNYDPKSGEERIERIASTFTREFIERYSIHSHTEIRPVFIVSLPRSGSTLTEQMLGMHSRITPGGELGKLAGIVNTLSVKWGSDPAYPDLETRAAQSDLEKAAAAYVKETAKLHLLHPYFTDKSLENFHFLGLIRMMFPKARVIHLRRHPLASALGIYRQRFGLGVPYSTDLGHIARHYQAYSRLMRHWAEVMPDPYLNVLYESLVQHPEQELKRIFGYLELDYEPDTLRYYDLQRPVDTASVVQVRQPLQTAGLDRHKQYSELLEPVAQALAGEISDYEAELEARLTELGNEPPD